MSRAWIGFLLTSVGLAFGDVQPLPSLPAGVYANAVQVDASGNIYVAGEYFAIPQTNDAPAHAFVGKLTPDGSRIVWWTKLAGSNDDRAYAIALGSDSSVYVSGATQSTDFPTTSGSMQPTTTTPGLSFAAKLNPAGGVVYSTYIGGSAACNARAIAVDGAGDAFITGSLSSHGGFPVTPGAVPGATGSNGISGFVIELDPSGSTAPVAISGFGGNAIAVDSAGNIYAAGSFEGASYDFLPPPGTAGAFEISPPPFSTCAALGFFGAFPCTYQHLAKFDPTGTRLIYGTYLTGTSGATPVGMAVDAMGDVIVAGSTNSPDYPTTPGAYQAEYFASPAEQQFALDILAPPSAGYVTKLNASGTALVWSTYFGGTGVPNGDLIIGMALDSSGNVLLAGFASSPDLPGLWSTPVASRPSESTALNFVARLSADGSTISPTVLLSTNTTVAALAVRPDGSALFGSPLEIVSVPAAGRVTGIADSADNARIVTVAPGQLLTLFGSNLAPAQSAVPVGFPTSFNGVSITFNGIAAPILYTSANQINLQVPYEVGGAGQVTMQVSSAGVSPALSEAYLLGVVDRQPSVFLSPAGFAQSIFDVAMCGTTSAVGLEPLAFNADGTRNSCANPAAAGSTVTIFLNGIGETSPAEATGTIDISLSRLSPSVQTGTPNPVTLTLPGSIAGLAQVQIPVASGAPFEQFRLTVGSTTPVRGPGILIWVAPAK